MDITMPQLDPMAWNAIGAGAVVLVVLVVWLVVRRRRRTALLRERFGPEYERTVEEAGRGSGEADLEERLERYEQLDLRSLPPESRRRYVERWASIQAEFVDRPTEAVREAERLSREAMAERGYPAEDLEERVGAISVDFPHLAERYRRAHGLPLDPEQDPLPTEELRQVLLDYRLLLEELLEVGNERERTESPAAPEAEPVA